jgi:hypothetical protein
LGKWFCRLEVYSKEVGAKDKLVKVFDIDDPTMMLSALGRSVSSAACSSTDI